jgi:hypothetical protein
MRARLMRYILSTMHLQVRHVHTQWDGFLISDGTAQGCSVYSQARVGIQHEQGCQNSLVGIAAATNSSFCIYFTLSCLVLAFHPFSALTASHRQTFCNDSSCHEKSNEHQMRLALYPPTQYRHLPMNSHSADLDRSGRHQVLARVAFLSRIRLDAHCSSFTRNTIIAGHWAEGKAMM